MVERVTRKNENLESELPLTISAQYGLIDQNEFFDKRIASRDVSGYYLLKKGEFAYNKSTSSDAPWGAVKRLDRYEMGVLSTLYIVFALKEDGNIDSDFLVSYYDTDCWHKGVQAIAAEGARNHGLLNITPADYFETVLTVPSNVKEQHQIGTFFAKLDSLITLHQRECFSFDFSGESAKTAQKTISWEQRKFSDFAQRESAVEVSSPDCPSVEYEDVIAEEGRLNKDIRLKETQKTGIKFDGTQVLYGKLRPYLHNWLNPDFTGVAVGDWWVLRPICIDKDYLYRLIQTKQFDDVANQSAGSKMPRADWNLISNTEFFVPISMEEQSKIAQAFTDIDTLITLHQREPPKEDKILNDIKTDTLFHEYYCQWLVIYKEGSVRGVTMQKYHLTAEWVKKLIPDVKLCDFDRITYQQLINDYAETHERQTTMDFHHQLKGAILDAVDDGLIARDPTRKVIIKGKSPNDKKKKYLSRYELQKLLTSLDLNSGLNMDWLILLIAKTGMRFSEAIAVTPADFDFTHQTLSVNKTWDYKGEGGFQPTKNKSSVRKIRLDWQTVGQFYAIVRELNDTAPIFVSKEKKIYNSTLNDVLERHCKAVGIPTISVHGLRHTHASLLLFDGVSIASVAQRLGHSSINTTQKTYLHIIRELENKDIDLIMKSISSLLD